MRTLLTVVALALLAGRANGRINAVLRAVRRLPFRDRVTVIVATDHGMMPVTRIVNVKRLLLNHGIAATALSGGTTSFLYLDDPTTVERAQAALSGYAEFQVVRPAAQPASWRLGTGPRVGDLIVSAVPPFFIEDTETWPWWLRWLGTWGPEIMWQGALKASHGYPSDTPGVQGILYVWGAGAAQGREVAHARAVDLHPTVCRLLGIERGDAVDGAVAGEFLE